MRNPTQIEPIFEERLRDMGDWLRNNGEAVYESKPWIFQNDTKTPGVWYTSGQTYQENVVYAIVLNYPPDSGAIRLYATAGQAEKPKQISMLGYPNNINVRPFLRVPNTV